LRSGGGAPAVWPGPRGGWVSGGEVGAALGGEGDLLAHVEGGGVVALRPPVAARGLHGADVDVPGGAVGAEAAPAALADDDGPGVDELQEAELCVRGAASGGGGGRGRRGGGGLRSGHGRGGG